MGKKREREESAGAHRLTFVESKTNSAGFFEWMVGMSFDQFFAEYFETKPLIVHRHNPKYYSAPSSVGSKWSLDEPLWVEWSTEFMKKIVREKHMSYATDVNVVRVDPSTGRRGPFKTSGRITEAEMCKCMADGWSVRFLRPHEHSPRVSGLVHLLEELTACSGGVNSYWTPANTQGFAAHYDDVDVFLLQLEGKKRWRLYDPPQDVDVLCRHSSEDYLPSELPAPTITEVLSAGDMMYMPRGMVHQGDTSLGEDSLHITLSANQMHTWADLMLQIVQNCIETKAANDVNWRKTIPRSLFKHLGAVHGADFRKQYGHFPTTGEDAKERALLLKHVRDLVAEVSSDCTTAQRIDFGVDQYARNVVRRRQPPMNDGRPTRDGSSVTLKDKIRPIMPGGVRLVMDTPGEAHVFHDGGNSATCYASVEGELHFEADFAPALAYLLSKAPTFVEVASLPMPAFEGEDADENRLVLAENLVNCKAFELE